MTWLSTDLPLAFAEDTYAVFIVVFWRVVALLTGMVVGSFLNVVIWRLPLGKNLSKPPSACPGCGAPIRWFDNIPVLAWLWLLGRCRACKMRISLRYPLIEALTGLLFLGAAMQYPADPVTIIVIAVALAALVAISFIDLDHRIIPDVISLPGIVVGIATAPFLGIHRLQYADGFLADPEWLGALLFAGCGALVGAVVILLVRALGSYVLGKEAMGLGDVKLLAMIGAFVGPVWALYALVLACFGGAMIGGAMYAFARRRAIPCVGVAAIAGEEHPFPAVRVQDRTLVIAGPAPAEPGAAVSVQLTLAAHPTLTDEDVQATFDGTVGAGGAPGSWSIDLSGPFRSPAEEQAYDRLEAFSEVGAGSRLFVVLGIAFGLAGLVAIAFRQMSLLHLSASIAALAFLLGWLRRPRARPCTVEAKAKGKAFTTEGARLEQGVLVFDAPRSASVGARVSLRLTLPAATIGESEDAIVETAGKIVGVSDRGGGATWRVEVEPGFVSEEVVEAYESLTMFGMSARYIPFGPFLSLAGAAMLLFGEEVAWFVGTGYPAWTRSLMGG